MQGGATEEGYAKLATIAAVRVQGSTPTDADIARLRSAFRVLAYEGSIDWIEHRDTRSPPWTIEVVLAAPFAAFFVKFAEAAGADAYQSLRAWIDGLRHGERERERSLTLRVTAGRAGIDIHSTLPDAALRALFTIEWADIEEGTLEWDPSRRQWRQFGADS